MWVFSLFRSAGCFFFFPRFILTVEMLAQFTCLLGGVVGVGGPSKLPVLGEFSFLMMYMKWDSPQLLVA